uniref:Uncharacterized protein n=1 Tax=Oryza glumipatula TaxID=40148 RepID=A0A0E0BHZ9_9ORYZ
MENELHKYTIGIAAWKSDTEVRDNKIRYRHAIALSTREGAFELAVSLVETMRLPRYRSFVEREHHVWELIRCHAGIAVCKRESEIGLVIPTRETEHVVGPTLAKRLGASGPLVSHVQSARPISVSLSQCARPTAVGHALTLSKRETAWGPAGLGSRQTAAKSLYDHARPSRSRVFGMRDRCISAPVVSISDNTGTFTNPLCDIALSLNQSATAVVNNR